MRRDPWKMALAVVAGLVVLACGGGAVTDTGPGATAPGATAAQENPAIQDVQLTACAMSSNQFMGPEATVRITNKSSKPSNYIVQVAFVSKDGATQFDTATVVVNGLAPGQVSDQQASSLKSEARQQAGAAGFTCKVLDVTRLAA